jgi:allantoinase
MNQMFDLAITNAHVVFETGVSDTNLYIKDEKVAGITSEALPAKETFDAEGRYLLPGAVDPHVHFNDPGYTEGEDFRTGSMAAAAGGITTVFEMPLTIPLTADKASFLLKKAEASKKSVVDFALYLALTPDNWSHVSDLMELEPVAFKAFMSYSPEIPMVNDGQLLAGMRAIRDANSIIAVHCENNEIINFLTAQLKEAGRKDPHAYAESRPAYAEWEAVQRAVNLATISGVQLHVVHSSTPEGARIVAEAKRNGHPISVETAPHYLFLDVNDLERRGPFAQCNPPLREAGNSEKLWSAIEAGLIDCIGSDHAPFTFAEKEPGYSSIWESPAGVNNIQTMIPLLLSEGIKRNIPLPTLARFFATTPAKLFGIYPMKGAIRVGADADMFLFNPAETWTVKPEATFYKQKWTPFEGLEVTGRIDRTWVRGTAVYAGSSLQGGILVNPGFGKFVSGGNNTKAN